MAFRIEIEGESVAVDSEDELLAALRLKKRLRAEATPTAALVRAETQPAAVAPRSKSQSIAALLGEHDSWKRMIDGLNHKQLRILERIRTHGSRTLDQLSDDIGAIGDKRRNSSGAHVTLIQRRAKFVGLDITDVFVREESGTKRKLIATYRAGRLLKTAEVPVVTDAQVAEDGSERANA